MNNSERPFTKSQLAILERLAAAESVFGGYLERARLKQLAQRGIVRRIGNKRVMGAISFEKWELADDGVRWIIKLGLAEAKNG